MTLAKIKNLNSLHIIKLGQRYHFLPVRLLFFFLKEVSDFFFAQSFSLRQLLHSVYGTAVQGANYQSLFKNNISVHTLEKAIDALIIGDNF